MNTASESNLAPVSEARLLLWSLAALSLLCTSGWIDPAPEPAVKDPAVAALMDDVVVMERQLEAMRRDVEVGLAFASPPPLFRLLESRLQHPARIVVSASPETQAAFFTDPLRFVGTTRVEPYVIDGQLAGVQFLDVDPRFVALGVEDGDVLQSVDGVDLWNDSAAWARLREDGKITARMSRRGENWTLIIQLS